MLAGSGCTTRTKPEKMGRTDDRRGPMAIPWKYDGKRVIVSGGGGAGMGAKVVDDLVELGAEIHVVDLKEPSATVASYQQVDLRDPAAIDDAVSQIGGRVDALFNCA